MLHSCVFGFHNACISRLVFVQINVKSVRRSCFDQALVGFVFVLSAWHACMQAKHGGTGVRFGDCLCADGTILLCVISGRTQNSPDQSAKFQSGFCHRVISMAYFHAG